ncbi:MAG: sugar ABC transporter permease [Eubacteriales bacterium]|nr:sugar ABC transporter permease [Eubacteriales bacterium]
MQKGKSKTAVKSVLFFTPSAALLLVFFIGPMLLTLFYSFTNMSLTGSAAQATRFVGFENFSNFFTDPKFRTAFFNTMIFLFFSGILGQQMLGFFVAYLMKKKNKMFRRIVGFIILIGWVTPEIVVSFMFSAFFAENGVLNRIIEVFGVSPVSWLFTFPMVSVIVANIWKGTAYSMMMFQAALDNIPDEVVESAKMDGANGWNILTRITIPMIKSTMSTTFILITLGTMNAFGLIFALTGGGPGLKTTTLSIFMYQKAFGAYQVGYGMAIALFILIIGIILSLLYIRSINKAK